MTSIKKKVKAEIPSNVVKAIVGVSISGLIGSFLVASTLINAMQITDANADTQNQPRN